MTDFAALLSALGRYKVGFIVVGGAAAWRSPGLPFAWDLSARTVA